MRMKTPLKADQRPPSVPISPGSVVVMYCSDASHPGQGFCLKIIVEAAVASNGGKRFPATKAFRLLE